MTTLIYQPERDCVNSLGIPVDNLTLETAVERIVRMARTRDGRARLVSTLNVDFLVNSLGTALTRPRHPELFDVLRGSDLVTADGFPIVWLSRLLGRPLAGRVCGSDLVPALGERCAREGLSLFLLGGGEGVAAEAGKTLEARYPGLRIAGTAAPFVRTTGPELGTAMEDDEALLERIHAGGADILLVGLGNPKQELWFNRNRQQLRTPVSIGVGGTFEFITGNVKRAPELWQRLNMEWVYRMIQDPTRLWKRYTKGLVKLAGLATPVLAARGAESFTRGRVTPVPADLPWRQLWSSRDQSIALLTLPSHPSAEYLARVNRDVSEKSRHGEMRILDFSRVKRVRLDSQQEYFNLAGLLEAQRGELQLMGLSPRVRQQLTAARLIDLLEGEAHGALAHLARRADAEGAFSCQSYALEDSTLVMLSGRITRDSLREIGFVECLLHSVRDRSCILDFRNVNLLESSGIAELMPLLTAGVEGKGTMYLSGVGYRIHQMLHMAEIETSARIINDPELLAQITPEQNHD